jgi:hypothetical protein
MSIMQSKRFRMNCGNGFGVMKSNGMNGMFGIKNHIPGRWPGLVEPALQAIGPEGAVLPA